MSTESQVIFCLNVSQDLFEGKFFALTHGIVELDSIRLFLLIFRLYFEVVGLVDDLEELTYVVLYLTLLTPQHVLLGFSALLLIVFDYQTLILYLSHSELRKSRLLAFDVV
jgi:hypothetical protein